MGKHASKSKPQVDRATAESSPVGERILAAFSARARRSGIRALLMGELASELRMSAMTLYKHFASKDELVTAMVDAWALELAAIDVLEWEKAKSSRSALELLLGWADAWTAGLSQVSRAFFEDLNLGLSFNIDDTVNGTRQSLPISLTDTLTSTMKMTPMTEGEVSI